MNQNGGFSRSPLTTRKIPKKPRRSKPGPKKRSIHVERRRLTREEKHSIPHFLRGCGLRSLEPGWLDFGGLGRGPNQRFMERSLHPQT
jgi:hypothetical protein